MFNHNESKTSNRTEYINCNVCNMRTTVMMRRPVPNIIFSLLSPLFFKLKFRRDSIKSWKFKGFVLGGNYILYKRRLSGEKWKWRRWNKKNRQSFPTSPNLICTNMEGNILIDCYSLRTYCWKVGRKKIKRRRRRRRRKLIIYLLFHKWNVLCTVQ